MYAYICIFYMPDCHIAHKNACILHAGLPRCTQKCTYSICRMCRNTVKMYTFYTADVQEAPRGTQGTQEAPGGLGSKDVTNHYVLPSKVARPTISRARDERDPHQVP